MYLKTKAAALETTEKNKFQLKGRYKSEGGGLNWDSSSETYKTKTSRLNIAYSFDTESLVR